MKTSLGKARKLLRPLVTQPAVAADTRLLISQEMLYMALGDPKNAEVRAKKILWRTGDPRVTQHFKPNSKERRNAMQKQYTIEIRADFADPAKHESLKKLIAQKTRELLASAALGNDGQAPDAAVFSEDFFIGREEINMLDNLVVAGKDEGVSQGLIDALKEEQEAKNG
jgi:hypothetical protein